MEVFTQFSSELDKSTKELLDHGIRLIELLKQPLSKPLPLHEQVILLYAANHKLLLDVPVKEIKNFRRNLFDYFEAKYPKIIEEIDTKKVLTDELVNQLIDATKEFKSR
jgi:F-type H+-transporting ATPase subunit alpha